MKPTAYALVNKKLIRFRFCEECETKSGVDLVCGTWLCKLMDFTNRNLAKIPFMRDRLGYMKNCPCYTCVLFSALNARCYGCLERQGELL